MITLITGGSGSGKSAYAEKYICHVSNEKGYKEKYYIATMQVFDDEGQRKIDRHRRLRAGKGFITIEQPRDIKKAVENFPDTKWRIVTIHQDIYGSGLDHSDTDGMILRTQLTPVFDKYDIDVVLQGHDHTYSRSKILYGDGKTHGSYEFRLDETGLDYDWDHAYNKNTGDSITLNPLSSDTAAVEAKDAFTADNKCYTIESSGKSVVTNPKGTLYMTANSASGSKYYELINSQQDYIEVRSQNWLPSYSVIDLTKDDFKITTYQITDEGKVENIDNTFTIHKTVSR